MSGTAKRMAAIYCLVLMGTALVGIAFAESGAACAATWKKVLYPDGSAGYVLFCKQNDCPTSCLMTGNGGFGPAYATCQCPGEFIHCNAAIRNITGWSSEEQCLGGCTQSQTELCPNIEEEPWDFDGWSGGNPVFSFACDCESA